MRLFFAYWPSAEKAAEIAEWVTRAHALYGGRMMRTDTLHMTLAFLGEVNDTDRQSLIRACRGWTLPSGSMVLQEPGRFRNAKVVWLGPGSPESAHASRVDNGLDWIYQANERLWQYLQTLGWVPRDSAFRPHVSLLRNAAPETLEALRGPPIRWTPDRCVLVGSQPSETGSRYTTLAKLPLDPTA